MKSTTRASVILLASVFCVAWLNLPARADDADEIAKVSEVMDGTKVPLKNNSEPKATSDLHKVAAVKIVGPYLIAISYYGTTLCVFERDPATAKLTFKTSFQNPLKTKWHWAALYSNELPNGDMILYYLYGGTMYWYTIDRKSGEATEAGKLEKVGAAPAIFSPDKRRVILLGNGGTVLKLDDKGAPAIESKRSTVANTGAFSPDGKNFYEASLTDVTTYAYDAKTGVTTQPEKLELTGHVEKLGTVFISISPDGKHVYVGQVSNGYGSAKRWFSWTFDRKADTGALAIKSSGEPERDLTQVEACFFSPDGKFGYFIQADPKDGEGYLSCPAWFTRDPDTGKLTFKGKSTAGRNCCMDYDPVVGHFYVGACGQDPKNSLIFAIKTKAFPVKNDGK